MRTVFSRSSQSLIPRYQENGALQLIVVTGVGFVLFHFLRIILLIVGLEPTRVEAMLYPNMGLGALETFYEKPWTILTYGWVHHGFWAWISNMIWTFCFASVLQSIISFKRLIPLFVYALIAGGIFYMAGQMIFHLPTFHPKGQVFMGAQAGVLALGIAAFTCAPRYRLSISPGFSIPLALIVGIYVFLDLIVFLPGELNALLLCAGGGLTGFVVAYAMKKGYDPTGWIYRLTARVEGFVTPDERKWVGKMGKKRMEALRSIYEPTDGITQDRIDEVLDKINEKGYRSLSREEMDILMKASKGS